MANRILNRKSWLLSCALAAGLCASLSFHGRTATGSAPAKGAFTFHAPKGFEEQPDLPGARSWKSGDAVVVVMEKQFEKLSEPPADDRKIRADLIDAQKLTNRFTGAHDYEISALKRDRTMGTLRVSIEGSYLRSNGEKVRFVKWQYYGKTRFSQIAYSDVEKSDSISHEKIQDILKEYKPFDL